MKKPAIFLICAALLPLISTGQNLADKTDALHIQFTNGKMVNTSELPEITWIQPKLEHSSTIESRINVVGKVTSREPIKEVSVLVGSDQDGSIVGKKSIQLDPDQTTVSIDQSVWLPEGAVFVEIEATNFQGVTVSSQRKLTVGDVALKDMVSMDRKDYALLFATDRYDHWDDLVNPVDDAHSLAKILEETYGFEVEIVTDPSSDEIWAKLRSYNERNFTPQDQLMIFFAGHGHYDESFGEGYVVATNSSNNDVARTSYISHNRLRGVIDNIPSEHVLLVMDVCFGGTLDPVLARSRGEMHDYSISVSDMLVRKFDMKTRKYLTSGGKEYVSDGIPGRHSPFMTRLLQSLGSRGGEDRVLTLSEIKVNMENLPQIPRFGSFGSDEQLSDFVFIAL